VSAEACTRAPGPSNAVCKTAFPRVYELTNRISPYGKPFLARFNLSYSDGMCLYAVSWRREVGIDIERIRRDLAFNRIAARFLSPAEVSTLRALPESARLQVFFRYRTRTEARLKAKGIGLDARAELAGWRVEEFCAQPGFAAALAAEGQKWRVQGPYRLNQ
jgi:hypothetical protein